MAQTVQDLFILTPKSGNRKTGAIPVSMSNKGTCPASCAMRQACYARVGRLGLVWHKLGVGGLTNGTDFTSFCEKVKTLRTKIWRHNQSGDLTGCNNRLHRGRCLQLARANCADGFNRGGYTYTHYSPLPVKGEVAPAVAAHNREVIKEMNALGFVVNLSGDNLEHADALADLNIGPVVTVLPMDSPRRLKTPKGRHVVVCPAILNSNVNCVDCKVCAKGNRKAIIGFPAHGTLARKADRIAKGEKL
jgi:hypothetical protein